MKKYKTTKSKFKGRVRTPGAMNIIDTQGELTKRIILDNKGTSLEIKAPHSTQSPPFKLNFSAELSIVGKIDFIHERHGSYSTTLENIKEFDII